MRGLVDSSVGAKILVALSGLGLTVYVVFHMIGNLKVFQGRDAINGYAYFLKHDLGMLLWIARGGLLAIFVLHIVLAMRLKLRSVAARPVAYQSSRDVQATIASRTMIWTGIVVGLFTLFHLAHFTFGWVKGVETSPGVVRNYLELNGREGAARRVLDGRGRVHEPWLAMLYVAASLRCSSTWCTASRVRSRRSASRTAASDARSGGWGSWSRWRCWWATWRSWWASGAARCRRSIGASRVMNLESKVPAGPLAEKWSRYKRDQRLINPANKAKYTIIVVGTGLAGASAAATLAELGYKVLCFCFQDSPRRAHTIAAQGGINAAKNYRNDGDSIYRLFYDTIKGGDFRSPRGERPPARGGVGQHHRPVRGPGRAVRPRIRRAARHALLRRGAAPAHLLLPRPDRAATSCSARTRRLRGRSRSAP